MHSVALSIEFTAEIAVCHAAFNSDRPIVAVYWLDALESCLVDI